MREGWQTKNLEKVCIKITDGSHYSPKTINEGFPYITVKDIGTENDQIDFDNCKFIGEKDYRDLVRNGCKPLNGDVLFSKDGTVGKVSLVDYDKDFVVLSSLAIIRPDNEIIDSAYLKYLLKAPFFLEHAIGKKTGVAIRRIVLKNLKTIPVSFPSLTEQRRIVITLDEAFEEIAVAVANTERNLANARELFENYLNEVFTQKGDGWVEKKLGDVCVLQRGFDLPKRLRSPGEFPLVSSSGIIDCHVEAKVHGPGVATGRSGSIGSVFYIEEDYWPLNTVLYVKEFFGNDPQFIYYLLKKFGLKRYASGAGVPTLNRNHVHSEKVNIPEDTDEQQKIVDRLNQLWDEMQILESIYQKKLSALAELKQSILQKAFSGELIALPHKSPEESVA